MSRSLPWAPSKSIRFFASTASRRRAIVSAIIGWIAAADRRRTRSRRPSDRARPRRRPSEHEVLGPTIREDFAGRASGRGSRPCGWRGRGSPCRHRPARCRAGSCRSCPCPGASRTGPPASCARARWRGRGWRPPAAGAGSALRLVLLDLLQEHLRIDDDAPADDALDPLVVEARRHQCSLCVWPSKQTVCPALLPPL